MFLHQTNAAKILENKALLQGNKMPVIFKLVIGSQRIEEEKLQDAVLDDFKDPTYFDVVSVNTINPGVLQLTTNVGPEFEVKIGSVGVLLDDGSIYTAGNYLSEGVFLKPSSMNFQLTLTMVRGDSQETDPLPIKHQVIDLKEASDQITKNAERKLNVIISQPLLAQVGFNAYLAEQSIKQSIKSLTF